MASLGHEELLFTIIFLFFTFFLIKFPKTGKKEIKRKRTKMTKNAMVSMGHHTPPTLLGGTWNPKLTKVVSGTRYHINGPNCVCSFTLFKIHFYDRENCLGYSSACKSPSVIHSTFRINIFVLILACFDRFRVLQNHCCWPPCQMFPKLFLPNALVYFNYYLFVTK